MSIKDDTLKLLSDLEWHCSCEIKSSQPAKVIKDLRNEGYEFYKNESGTRWAKNMYCPKCERTNVHRKLLSTKKTKNVTERVLFSPKIRKRVLALYNGKDVLTGGYDRLEVDHRITPDRISEKPLPENVTDEELKNRYMILTRINNHIKREACKKCINTNTRQKSITGINYFYEGNEKYEGTCIGCFWAFPEEWKKSLNAKIKGNV